MKSAKHRDDMVVMVQAASKKYPTLDSVPVGGKPASDKSKIITWPVGASGYVAALYELSYRGAQLIGRTKDGTELVGEVVAESGQASHTGKVMTVEAEKK